MCAKLVALAALLVTLASALPATATNSAAPASFSALTLPFIPGVNASAFFTVTTPTDDTLLSASSECCAAVELHSHSMKDGIMRMRREDSVKLKAGKPLEFVPGGLHVMLIGLKKPLKNGQKIALTFHFKHAPEQTVTFTAAPRLHQAADSPSHH